MKEMVYMNVKILVRTPITFGGELSENIFCWCITVSCSLFCISTVVIVQIYGSFFPSAFFWEVSLCGWTDSAGGRLLDVLAWIPASNGSRDGPDLVLIPDVELCVCVE